MSEITPKLGGNGYRLPKLLDDYIGYYVQISEAPLLYHFLACLFVISAIVGRRRYIVQGEQRIYGNLYVLVAAPSSLYKKSALASFGQWLNGLGLEHLTIGQIGSPEGLAAALAINYGQGVLFYPEFGTLLGKASASYMQSILELISELYDCPPIFQKFYAKRIVQFFDVYLNVLATSQYYSLGAYMKEAALLSGFLPRFLVCTATDLQPHIIRRPRPNADLGDSLHRRFTAILAATENHAEMDLTKDAWAEFERWGHQRYEEALKAHPLIQPIFGRIETHALKLCLLFGLATDPREHLVSTPVVRSAIAVADRFLEMYQDLTGRLAYSDHQRRLEKVEELIKTRNEMPRRELLHATRSIPRPQLDQILETLRQMGSIEIKKGKRGGHIYVWL